MKRPMKNCGHGRKRWTIVLATEFRRMIKTQLELTKFMYYVFMKKE